MSRPPDFSPPADAAFWAKAVGLMFLGLSAPAVIIVTVEVNTNIYVSPEFIPELALMLFMVGSAAAYLLMCRPIRNAVPSAVRGCFILAAAHATVFTIAFVIWLFVAIGEDSFDKRLLGLLVCFVLAGLTGGLVNLLVGLRRVIRLLYTTMGSGKGFEPIMPPKRVDSMQEDQPR
jgi:hypothetical protein